MVLIAWGLELLIRTAIGAGASRRTPAV